MQVACKLDLSTSALVIWVGKSHYHRSIAGFEWPEILSMQRQFIYFAVL